MEGHSVAGRGHSVLLGALHRASGQTQPLQGLIVHCLAQLPTPTPLAATIVASPLFRPFSLTKLDALKTAFRHAVHAKIQAAPSGLFVPSLNVQLNTWLSEILRGLEGGHAITRLACCSGLLLGVEDVLPSRQPGSVHNEIILAFADVVDLFTSSDSWGKEFRPETEGGEDALTLSLITSAQALLLVPPEKFVALPLPQTLALLVHTINKAFVSGTFLASFGSSLEYHPEYKIHVGHNSPVFQQMDAVSASHAMTNMGSLSRICSRSVSLFVEHRPKLALPHVQETFHCLESIARNVELGWLSTNLAEVTDDSIAPKTRPLTQSIWTILKTFLFCTIMITEAGLSTLIYVPPALGHMAPLLALSVLRNLSHLAFVIQKFGGAGHGAFQELKRAFYLALDILAVHKAESEHFVQQLCEGLWSNPHDLSHPVQQAKKAFALSAIEQLVPALSTPTIKTFVLPFCSPHLNDTSHREIFEAAHSVVLAIFSHGAQNPIDTQHEQEGVFIATWVPFYVQCLIENSAEGKLNVAQLRLAFAALIKAACSLGDHALAWFCIDSLLTACKESSFAVDGYRIHGLHLALVASVSSVPLTLLPRMLSVVNDIIVDTEKDDMKRSELLEALFQEIMNNVGDAEKAFAVSWWNEQCMKWPPHVRLADVGPGTRTSEVRAVDQESGELSKL